jgi:hypothetical protein
MKGDYCYIRRHNIITDSCDGRDGLELSGLSTRCCHSCDTTLESSNPLFKYIYSGISDTIIDGKFTRLPFHIKEMNLTESRCCQTP